MEDGASSCTSADGTEDFGNDPTRDLLTEGLVGLVKPVVDSLEESIKSTRQSQVELRNQIEILSTELHAISQNQQCPVDLEVYVKKLLEARRRITIVNSILQNAQDRLNRIHQLAAKEITLISPATVGNSPNNA